MERIGDAVQREFRRIAPRAGMAELVACWPAAVGEQIARNAWPARLARDGTLHVAAVSAAWAFELTNLRDVVLGQLRAALGPDAPKRVAFAPGNVPATDAPPPVPQAAGTLTVGASERARAEEVAAGAANEELRDRVAAAVAAALARASADRTF